MYPTNLNEMQFNKIQKYLDTRPENGGRPPRHSKLDILNAILYVLKTGCQWRMLPKDFPPWQTTYGHFKRWLNDGTFEHINKKLTEEVSSVLLDSRSVRASQDLKKR